MIATLVRTILDGGLRFRCRSLPSRAWGKPSQRRAGRWSPLGRMSPGSCRGSPEAVAEEEAAESLPFFALRAHRRRRRLPGTRLLAWHRELVFEVQLPLPACRPSRHLPAWKERPAGARPGYRRRAPRRSGRAAACLSSIFVTTSTSSSLLRSAAGRTRILRKSSLPGVTFVTLPTSRPLGKIPSPPLVRTISPAGTVSSLITFSSTTSPAGVPRSMPCSRVLSRIAPTPLVWSSIKQHLRSGAVHAQHLAHDAVRGDDRHVGLDAVALTFVDVDRTR